LQLYNIVEVSKHVVNDGIREYLGKKSEAASVRKFLSNFADMLTHFWKFTTPKRLFNCTASLACQHSQTSSTHMIFQTRASSTTASANRRDMPGASRYNHESDSTHGDLEVPVSMASITEASMQPDFLALRFEAPARIDSNSPLQGDGFDRNLRTHGIEALGRPERVNAQRHDAYLCEARLRHFGARRQRVQKMQSSYSFRVGSGLSTEEDT
jgi:hypothetical protein